MKKRNTLALGLSILLLTACLNDDRATKTNLDAVYAYQPNSQYAPVLRSCAEASRQSTSCQLTTLPPLGMDNETLTKSAIMERVIVSHDWMGTRFEQLLDQLPNDLIQLFGAITVVTIADDIRPSFYQPASGGIYLDPADLWLTQEEKAVISQGSDFRAAFADPMGFRVFARYSKGNADAFTAFGLDSTKNRSIDDIVIPMASLLFHELAHANDFLPPAQYAGLSRTQSFFQATQSITQISDVLNTMFGLESAEMFRLAQVLFAGASPSDTDLARTAPEVGGFFDVDQASDNYSYFTRFEDLAMLFEEAMMKKHFGVDRNLAFVSNPAEPEKCHDFVVGWGVRNRFADAEVKIRAEWAANQLLPSSDHSTFFDELPAPQAMEVGKGWCEALVIEDNNPEIAADERAKETEGWYLEHMERPYAPFNGVTPL